MIVADSDVLIDALRGREPSKSRIDFELATGSLATTAISAFELRSGARTASEASKVTLLLAAMAILPFDDAAATSAADARLKLKARGATIGMADFLIAGICLSRSAILLTRNRSHFERVDGLSLGSLSA